MRVLGRAHVLPSPPGVTELARATLEGVLGGDVPSPCSSLFALASALLLLFALRSSLLLRLSLLLL